MMDTGDQVVHIGENAEIVRRQKPPFAALLDTDDPVETNGPATTISALSAAADMIHGGYWRPAIIEAYSPETDSEDAVLVFVNDDDPTEVILVCPATTPKEYQETTA